MGFTYQSAQPKVPKPKDYGVDYMSPGVGVPGRPGYSYGNDVLTPTLNTTPTIPNQGYAGGVRPLGPGAQQTGQQTGYVNATASPVTPPNRNSAVPSANPVSGGAPPFFGADGTNYVNASSTPVIAPTTQPGGANNNRAIMNINDLNQFAQQGVNNLGIGQKPPTFEELVSQYNSALGANGGQFKLTPITPPRIEVPQIGAPPQVQAGQVAAPGPIQAPRVDAAQVDLGDAGAFQKALYESIYRPVDRELTEQLAIQNREAQARLTNAGLGGSGVEQAVLGQIRDQNSRQRAAAMFDASNQATVQRFGYEFQTKLFNAQQEQQARLANANFDIQAQISTAQNLLQAGIANAQLQTQASIANAQNATQTNIAQAQLAGQINVQNAQLSFNSQLANNQLGLQQSMQQQQTYFNLLGLSLEQGRAASQEFLQFMALAMGDLQHLDRLEFDIWSTSLNTYLQQLSQIVNAGTGGGSKGSGESSNFGISVSATPSGGVASPEGA